MRESIICILLLICYGLFRGTLMQKELIEVQEEHLKLATWAIDSCNNECDKWCDLYLDARRRVVLDSIRFELRETKKLTPKI